MYKMEINGETWVKESDVHQPICTDESRYYNPGEHSTEAGLTCRNLIGNYAIVRSQSAGVFAGKLTAKWRDEVMVDDCRRLWSWATAGKGITLSDVARCGLDGANSRVCVPEDNKWICGVIELCWLSDPEVIQSIKDAPTDRDKQCV